MPTSRIGSLHFDYGIEDIVPVEKVKTDRLPDSGNLLPSHEGMSSHVEELVRANSFEDTIDAFINPEIANAAICRPERYNALLRDVEESVSDDEDDPDLRNLAKVLKHQGELRGLLQYYVQSLLNA